MSTGEGASISVRRIRDPVTTISSSAVALGSRAIGYAWSVLGYPRRGG